MRREEPGLQREMATVHERARSYRRLPPAVRAFPGAAHVFQLPAPAASAGQAHEAIPPAHAVR